MRLLRDLLPAPGGPAANGAGPAGPDEGPSGWFERIFLPAMLVSWAVGEPVVNVGRVLDGPHRADAAVAAVAAGGCSVPLYSWLLLPAARGRRPRSPGWLIAAFAAINLAAFAVIGAWWFGAGMNLAILAAVNLPLRWSVPAVAALAAVPAVMAAARHDVEQGQFFAQSTVVGALVMGPSFWLVRIAARLRAGRRELAGRQCSSGQRTNVSSVR